MAGKVKNKDDAGTQSKTARASMRTGGAKESFIASADASRVVPLGGGTHAYVLDPRDGRTLRYPVTSDKFIDALVQLAGTNHGDRLRRDLTDLAAKYPSWQSVTARLDAVLNPPAPEATETETPEVEAAEVDAA
ncbi:MAG: hypothetical protein ACRDZ3_23100 [Acidimicrobiia bacterium]